MLHVAVGVNVTVVFWRELGNLLLCLDGNSIGYAGGLGHFFFSCPLLLLGGLTLGRSLQQGLKADKTTSQSKISLK